MYLGVFVLFLSSNLIYLETLICYMAEDNIQVLCLRTLFECCCVLSCSLVMGVFCYFHPHECFSPVFQPEQEGVSLVPNP